MTNIKSPVAISSDNIPWIKVCSHSPYFKDDNGDSFTPIGQNDAISWPDFEGLYRRQDPVAVDAHLAYLAAHGVNCLRMMMEYCHTDNRYLEKPVGRFQPNMVQFWDDLFLLCKKHKIRIFITPFDTFWMARRWKFHPYNKRNGGPCASKWQWMKSPEMLQAIKVRLDFFIERWGADGTLFGWDVWNEVSPLHAGKSMSQLVDFIEELSQHIRDKEMELYQKSHLQTVSVFGPLLQLHDMTNLIFQHPLFDFATVHFYDEPALDNPKKIYCAARATSRIIKDALVKIVDGRPFMDSEHGPISYFRKHRQGLPEVFDDWYFLAVQWVHLASGAAGGGMRWPYRHPHVLTHGMRRAQLNLSHFAKMVNWQDFQRSNLEGQITVDNEEVHAFGCGDDSQCIVWLLRSKTKRAAADNTLLTLSIPGLTNGDYRVVFWDTLTGQLKSVRVKKSLPILVLSLTLPETDLALFIQKQS